MPRCTLNKLTLYESKTRFYVVGQNQHQRDAPFRILKIDRTDVTELNITDDRVSYSGTDMAELLKMIELGNKGVGGLQKVSVFYGILGFVRFLEGYYMIIITKRSPVALVGGRYIYHIDSTQMIAIPGPGTKVDRKTDEARYLQIFNQVDLSKNFYFSYTYDVTQTLQSNMTRESGVQEMFMWNSFLLSPVSDQLSSDWILPVIHGFVDQAKISIYGQNVFVTLIARRSRYFAGARFLKRGLNDQGFVANDVETEQIVHDAKTTFFSYPPGRYGLNPSFTSFVQHRGSIPLYWSQETVGMAAKPPIQLNLNDPYYCPAAQHFAQMMSRYSCPIIVLNLVKGKEKRRREAILLEEFTDLVSYLNQFPPTEKKLRYIAWDMARASKSDQDVIAVLENIAEEVIQTTGFFHSGPEPYINAVKRSAFLNEGKVSRILERQQSGVLRTNCIDCLDRTNAAQFVVAKEALGHQLYALGIISEPTVPFDSDAVNLLNVMYHDHGDTIALQYGGSHLVNTMETYRKISPWTSHSRDMIESIRRYYSNSFTDAEKQDAMNIFLGLYVPSEGAQNIWDLPTDHFLHNADPRHKAFPESYMDWWKTALGVEAKSVYGVFGNVDDSRFIDYYRPQFYTTFADHFAFDIMGTMTRALLREDASDLSPFSVRVNMSNPNRYLMMYSLNIGGVKRWLTLANEENSEHHSKSQFYRHTTHFLEEKRKSEEEADETRQVASTDTFLSPVSTPGYVPSESLSKQHLDSFISSADKKEYNTYLSQFDPDAPSWTLGRVLDSSSTKKMASHPDLSIFESHISANDDDYKSLFEYGDTGSGDESAAVSYEEEFALYADMALKTQRLLPSKSDASRYSGYRQWIQEGVYTKIK